MYKNNNKSSRYRNLAKSFRLLEGGSAVWVKIVVLADFSLKTATRRVERFSAGYQFETRTSFKESRTEKKGDFLVSILYGAKDF